MVKKRINKKVVKTKSSNFKIPDSFSELNFRNKIIAIVLITLVIGIVAILFSNNITGMAPLGQSFEMLKGTLGGVNNIITTIFGVFFPGEKDPLIVYARFVLFALVIGVIYFLMKIVGSENPFINFSVGVAIAYLSTFFVPMDVILASGILYSSTFMSLILLIPFCILILIYVKLPKTKAGYIVRVILSLIMIGIINQNVVPSGANTAVWIMNMMSILSIGAVIAFGYAFIEIFLAKTSKEAEEKATKGVALTLRTRIDQLLARGAKKGPKP